MGEDPRKQNSAYYKQVAGCDVTLVLQLVKLLLCLCVHSVCLENIDKFLASSVYIVHIGQNDAPNWKKCKCFTFEFLGLRRVEMCKGAGIASPVVMWYGAREKAGDEDRRVNKGSGGSCPF